MTDHVTADRLCGRQTSFEETVLVCRSEDVSVASHISRLVAYIAYIYCLSLLTCLLLAYIHLYSP